NVEKEARERAMEHVAKLIQRPDQLDRIGEMKKKGERKKLHVEAMLRTSVQSQLAGIRTAISKVRTAADDVIDVETETMRIHESLKPFPALQQKMRYGREWSERHDQYAAAIENLRLIVEMHDLIADSKVALTNGQLLLVHKNIVDLERARGELMYEVHKLDGPTMEKDKKVYGSSVRDLTYGMNSGKNMCSSLFARVGKMLINAANCILAENVP
ncbi:hypothetical protein PENTCL1PPCAC_7959, partial [Pristionchus entomophagus]